MISLPAAAVFGVDLVVVAAFVLLAAGVVGALLPGVPAALFSLAGVFLYWWGSGYTEPGTILLIALVIVCLLTVLADWFGGLVAARVGGASRTSVVLGGIVAVLSIFVAGPLGVLVGAGGTVFVVEYLKHRDARKGATAAGAYVVGFFASTIVQALLTASVLVTMLAVAII